MKKNVAKKYRNEFAKSVSTIVTGYGEAWDPDILVLPAKPIKGSRLKTLLGIPGVFPDRWEQDGLLTEAVKHALRVILDDDLVDAQRIYQSRPKFNPNRRYVIHIEWPRDGGSVWYYRISPV